MAKTVQMRNPAQMEFQKVFQQLCYTKSSWQVWTDFIFITAAAISNSCDQSGPVHDEREKAYMSVIKRYTKNEVALFPKLFAIIVEALEQEPEQDFLGELFMGLELGNHWKGQFFTPYCVCKMMAEVTVDSNVMADGIQKRGWIGINDPACGAGATLIATRNVMLQKKLSPYNALFVGQDIDRTAALMCYIQLSLLGCAGYVVVADTIRYPVTGELLLPCINEHQELWAMPMLYSDVWAGRILWHRMDLLVQSAFRGNALPENGENTPPPELPPAPPSNDEKEEPAKAADTPPALNETKNGQLTLF